METKRKGKMKVEGEKGRKKEILKQGERERDRQQGKGKEWEKGRI